MTSKLEQLKAMTTVVADTGDLEVESLRTWCRDKMPRYWMPSVIRILPEMPRNVMGKVNKKELVKTLFPSSSG